MCKKTPRSATAQFVRRLDWLVNLYKDTDLRVYVNGAALEKFGVMDAVQKGKLAGEATQDAITSYGAQPAPAVCCWVTDQEQSQLTGGEYITEVLRVSGVRFFDWFHRCWNDVAYGVAFAGLMPVWYAMAFVYNIGHGP